MGYQEMYNYVASEEDKEILLNLFKRYGIYTNQDANASLVKEMEISHDVTIDHKKYKKGSKFLLIQGEEDATNPKNISKYHPEANYTPQERMAIKKTVQISADTMDTLYGINKLTATEIEVPQLTPSERNEINKQLYPQLSTQFAEFLKAHQILLKERQKETGYRPTLVVNAYAGAGAGKTTACLEVAENLKKQGYVVEYVQEYAKELVWDKQMDLLDGTQAHQLQILDEQMKRMDRLYGRVDYIVTDSPLLLNGIYNQELTPEYDAMLTELNNQYKTFSFFVERDTTNYEEEGRLQTLEGAIEKDNEVETMLQEKNIYYGKYTHSTIQKVVKNLQTSLDKLRNQKENVRIARHQSILNAIDTKYQEFISITQEKMEKENETKEEAPSATHRYQWVKRYLRMAYEKEAPEEIINKILYNPDGMTEESVIKAMQEENLYTEPRYKIYTKEEQKQMSQELKEMIPIIDVANKMGYSVQRKGSSSRYYTLEEHDSVIMDMQEGKNCFYRNSTMVHSSANTVSNGACGSVLDFVMYFGDKTPTEAYAYLYDMVGGQEVVYNRINGIKGTPYKPMQDFVPKKEKKQAITLPERAHQRNHVYAYLHKTRGISEAIINDWFEKGMLYQDNHNNCVFLSPEKDKKGTPVFGCVRGTNTQKRFVLDLEGSDYAKGFYINNDSKEVIICESAIDAMSLMTIAQMQGKDYHAYNYLIMASATKHASLYNILDSHPEIETVRISLDNDTAGRKALNTLTEEVEKRGKKATHNLPTQDDYDWNKYLTEIYLPLKSKQPEQKQEVKLYPLSRQISREARAYQYWLEEQAEQDTTPALQKKQYTDRAKEIDDIFLKAVTVDTKVTGETYGVLKNYVDQYQQEKETEKPRFHEKNTQSNKQEKSPVQEPQPQGIKKYRLSQEKIQYATKYLEYLSTHVDNSPIEHQKDMKDEIQEIKQSLQSMTDDKKVDGTTFGRFKIYEEKGKNIEQNESTPTPQSNPQKPYIIETNEKIVPPATTRKRYYYTTLEDTLKECVEMESKGVTPTKILVTDQQNPDYGEHEYNQYLSITTHIFVADKQIVDGMMKYIKVMADKEHMTKDFLERNIEFYQQKGLDNKEKRYDAVIDKMKQQVEEILHPATTNQTETINQTQNSIQRANQATQDAKQPKNEQQYEK